MMECDFNENFLEPGDIIKKADAELLLLLI